MWPISRKQNKNKQKKTQRHKEEDPVEMEAEIGMMRPQAPGSPGHQKLEEARKDASFLERVHLCQHYDFRLSAAMTAKE